MAERIMIVDDEVEIADLLEVYLLNEGFEVYKYYNGEEAIACADTLELDLAILDIMLPDIDGLTVCRSIRQKSYIPIILLTAKVEDMDKITGLAMGADDYITKPFNPLEVIARVKAQLRRYKRYNENNEEEKNSNIYDNAGLYVNKETHECIVVDEKIELTPIEFSILWLLCENSGKVVSSETIFEKVWGEKYLECNNTVMVHIRRLREKLKEPSKNPRYVKTVWGVGYKIENSK